MYTTVRWRGVSGAMYEFEVYPVGQLFNPVSGVYIFCRELFGGSWEALYVGEAGSLKQRLNDGIASHDGYRRAKATGATHVAAMRVSGDAERIRVETDLRHGLNPSCNAQGVNALSLFEFLKK